MKDDKFLVRIEPELKQAAQKRGAALGRKLSSYVRWLIIKDLGLRLEDYEVKDFKNINGDQDGQIKELLEFLKSDDYMEFKNAVNSKKKK